MRLLLLPMLLAGPAFVGPGPGSGPGALQKTEARAVVSASVEDVVEAAEAVFPDLEIRHVQSAVTPIVKNFGMAAGARADDGGVQVHANKIPDGTEITVTSSSPPDPELEQRVLDAVVEKLEEEGTAAGADA